MPKNRHTRAGGYPPSNTKDFMDFLPPLLHTILSFIAVMSIIVFVHEFGHYVMARLCGVRVEVFSIGFGKELFGWTTRSGTRWKFATLPLGGYVKMFGDASAASTPDNDALEKMSDADRKMSFHYQPLWRKSLIVAGGPLFNFLLTIAVFTFLVFQHGVASSEPVVGKVLENSAAAEAGLQIGDRFLKVNDQTVYVFQDIPLTISTNLGAPLTLTILRNEKTLILTVIPKILETKDTLGNVQKIPRIGVESPKLTLSKLGAWGALRYSVEKTYQICALTLRVIGQLITGQRDTDQLKGPLGIAKLSGQATQSGTGTFIWFIAMLSANLGLMNLLPIPMLDGGHLLYYLVEAVRGKPLAQNIQQFGFRIGIALLASLMVFTLFNDVMDLFKP
jgi:regulator of sigma E protease